MKKILALITAASLTSSIFAFDFGGSIYNDSSLKNIQGDSDLKFDQLNEIGAWVSVPFNNEGTTAFNLSGKYQFEKDFGAETTTHFADINTANFTYTKNNFGFTAGRFAIADSTAVILNQSLDGLCITNTSSEYDINLTLGYTGLLNKHFNSILNEELAAYETDTDKAYDVCEKYGVLAAGITLPYIWKNQTVTAENVLAVHLEGKSFYRNYATVGITGAITNDIYYTASGTIEYSKYDDANTELANLSKLNVTYFGNSHGLALSLNGIYASGSQGPFDSFKGFTSQTAVDSNADNTEYSSLVISGVSGSVKPVETCLLSAKADLVFSAVEDIKYAGFEYGLGCNWQVLSDVLLSASINQYMDKDDSDNDKTKISLKALITF